MPPMLRLAQQTITTRIRTGSASVESSTRMSPRFNRRDYWASPGHKAMVKVWNTPSSHPPARR